MNTIKKLFALVLCLSIFTVHANVNGNSLESAFKDLNISLQVEWDQQDQEKYYEIMGDFQKKVKELQDQGLSNQELIDYTVNNVVNKQVGKDLKSVFEKIEAQNLSQKEARELVLKHMGKFYTEGSSWAGRGGYVALVAVIAVLAIAVTLAVVLSPGPSNGGSTGGSTGGNNDVVCYEDWVCYDYYDYYWNSWYTDCYYDYYCY